MYHPDGFWLLSVQQPLLAAPFSFTLFLSPTQAKMSEATSRRIRAVFGAANFWAIVLYNILALNSLEFALLVTRRLLVTGKVPMAFYPTEQSLS